MNAMPMKKSLYLQMAGSHPTEYRTIPFSTIVLHALMGSFPVGQPFGNSSATCPRPCGGASAEKKAKEAYSQAQSVGFKKDIHFDDFE